MIARRQKNMQPLEVIRLERCCATQLIGGGGVLRGLKKMSTLSLGFGQPHQATAHLRGQKFSCGVDLFLEFHAPIWQ